jgi:uncharacterized UBP type Zn finger protein
MTIIQYQVAQDGQGRETDRTCGHLGTIADVSPSTPGACEDCLREGTKWVHLRMCLACGHVGCCDSSPRRHATAHLGTSAHPLIRSLESGEDWVWCYDDELVLIPAGD